ncbi:Slc8a2 [Symbiodinium natans]|uniref:Slc8a2 protein n=1 Tax=Symbiodinium natans TaxID=878477 RepID=A0A812JUA1_9DINO|nr:Slc8a2 [Symbiodinium natans]
MVMSKSSRADAGGMRAMKALVVVQCFPPLLKNAGGVSKRYFTLCRALIDGLGWQVTLMTPVDCTRSSEKDIQRWLAEGKLVHLPARGVRVRSSTDGVAVFLDLFSYANAAALLRETMIRGGYDCLFLDDVPA